MNVHVAAPANANAKAQRESRSLPRFKVPARLILGEQSFATVDWSRNGIGFTVPGLTAEVGQSFDAALCFDLAQAPLSVPVIATLRHYDPKSGRGGLSFIASPEGFEAIDFIIEGYLAGRIIVMDGLLTKSDTLRSAPAAAPRAPTISLGARIRRLLGLGVISLAGAAALYFLGTSAYDRIFVFEAVSSQISFPTVEIDSPVAGTLTSTAPTGSIAKDAPLFTLVDAAGVETSIKSPCACTIVGGGKEVGSYVAAGNVVARLIDDGTPPQVLVSVAFPDMKRVYDGAAIDLKFIDGTAVPNAHIVTVRSLGGQQSGLVTIEVEPGRELDASRYGEPVYARFDTAPWRKSN